MAWSSVTVVIMKNINVIDLDKTLIPFDSFKKYVFYFFKNKNFTLKIFTLIILRKLRLISLSLFKKRIIETARTDKNYCDKMKNFSNDLSLEVDESIIEMINNYTNNNTVNILCTASPEDYVKELARKNNWRYVCTSLSEDGFIHMHGTQKVKSIKSQYPHDVYNYNFAISDSKSDIDLLKLFDKYELIAKK